MKAVICQNSPSNQYVSALSKDMLDTLSDSYDIVVNEHVRPDFVEHCDDCWCQIVLANNDLAERLKGIFDKNLVIYWGVGVILYPGKTCIGARRSAKEITEMIKEVVDEIVIHNSHSDHIINTRLL